MKNIVLAALLISSALTQAQYYYKDIIGTAETNHQLKLYIATNVQSVVLKSFEPDGSVSDNFQVEQLLDKNAKTLKTVSHSGVTDESVLLSFFDDSARVIKTMDTSGTSFNAAAYTYNGAGKLLSLKSFSGTDKTLFIR